MKVILTTLLFLVVIKANSQAPADTIYAVKEVDEPPVTGNGQPITLRSASYRDCLDKEDDSKVDLQVIVNFVVNKDGTVSDIQIEKGVSPCYDNAAYESVAFLKFKPGIKNGKPVATRVAVAFNFMER